MHSKTNKKNKNKKLAKFLQHMSVNYLTNRICLKLGKQTEYILKAGKNKSFETIPRILYVLM
jgi:hypothetical protein